jgi:hypothetical protein
VNTIDRFLPFVRLAQMPDLSDDAFTLDRDGAIRVAWAPFEYVPKHPKLALVGITPGRFQAERALATFGAALRDGLSSEDALRRVKATASFSGPMRANLVAMLDHVGVHRALGVASCAEVFGAAGEPAHFTSALRYPVFINGTNYSGAPDLLRADILRRWVVGAKLGEDARRLPDVLWVPLGSYPAKALHHFAAQGLIDRNAFLTGYHTRAGPMVNGSLSSSGASPKRSCRRRPSPPPSRQPATGCASR